MIDLGLPVALATDFNPGTSPTENLGLVAALGCSLLKMTPEEVDRGRSRATRQRRWTWRTRTDRSPSAVARDLVILDAPSYTFLPYRMGTNLVHTVLVRGRVVVRNRRIVPS